MLDPQLIVLLSNHRQFGLQIFDDGIGIGQLRLKNFILLVRCLCRLKCFVSLIYCQIKVFDDLLDLIELTLKTPIYLILNFVEHLLAIDFPPLQLHHGN